MKKLSLKNKSIYPDYLHVHSAFHQDIRNYLSTKKYEELWCPPLSHSPCFETHVHPLQMFSSKSEQKLNLYLHTSPEFILKSYLANTVSAEGIFSLNYVFRDDEKTSIHRKQFIMLEFYKVISTTSSLVEDLNNLLIFVSEKLSSICDSMIVQKFQTATVQDLFLEKLNLDILNYLCPNELYTKIQKDFKEISPQKPLPWDDLFNLLWLNYIESTLKHYNSLLVTQYPSPLSLLAKENQADKRVSNRFELFVQGVELANGYEEEFNYEKNLQVLNNHLSQKEEIYNYKLNQPEFFLRNLKENNMPSTWGVALGTERLLQVLTSAESAFIDI